MLNRILFSPDGAVAIPAAGSATPKSTPSSTTPPASSAPPPAASAPSVVDDDPFSPPKRPDSPPAAKPAANGAAPVSPDIDKLAPKELRERVKQLNAEKEAFGSEKSKLEAKIKEFESRGVDTSALTTRLTAIEKERDAALADLRAARQEASPEFIEKYDKPFNRTANSTKAKIEQLQVINPEDQSTRPATWADFTTLYGLPVGKAIEQANAMFGATAPFVINKLEQLRDLDDARANALQEEKAQFKERTAKDIAEQAKNREGVGKLWMDTNKRLSQSDSYKVDPTDAELSEAAKHAETVFDSSINAADKDDFVKQKVLKDAHIKQKTIGYSVRGIIINRQKAEIETLKKQIDELKGTAPGGVQRAGGADAEKVENDEDWEAAAIREVKAKGG